jgi:Sec-independent protein translocase protein TatA
LVVWLPTLAQEFKSVGVSIGRVRDELQQAKAESDEAVAAAEAKAQETIDDLKARLDATQALDLTWAIVGLFITAGGILLSYWA